MNFNKIHHPQILEDNNLHNTYEKGIALGQFFF